MRIKGSFNREMVNFFFFPHACQLPKAVMHFYTLNNI